MNRALVECLTYNLDIHLPIFFGLEMIRSLRLVLCAVLTDLVIAKRIRGRGLVVEALIARVSSPPTRAAHPPPAEILKTTGSGLAPGIYQAEAHGAGVGNVPAWGTVRDVVAGREGSPAEGIVEGRSAVAVVAEVTHGAGAGGDVVVVEVVGDAHGGSSV